MVDLVLFDASTLTDAAIRQVVGAVLERGAHLAAIADRADVADALSAAGEQDRFDLWFAGSTGQWPFDRAARMTGVEPEHTLFVSTEPGARQAAEQAGIRTLDPHQDDIDRYLG
jgi:FMN phosphatase YigB (HAD superfamily)